MNVKVVGEHMHKGKIGEFRNMCMASIRHYRGKGYSHTTTVQGMEVKFPDMAITAKVPFDMCEEVE